VDQYFKGLIEASSLGTPAARRIRSSTPSEVIDDVRRRIEDRREPSLQDAAASGHHPATHSPGRIAGLPGGTLYPILARLKSMGWVKDAPSPGEGRRRRISARIAIRLHAAEQASTGRGWLAAYEDVRASKADWLRAQHASLDARVRHPDEDLAAHRGGEPATVADLRRDEAAQQAQVAAETAQGSRKHQRLPGWTRLLPTLVLALDFGLLLYFFAGITGVNWADLSPAALGAAASAAMVTTLLYGFLGFAGSRLRGHKNHSGSTARRRSARPSRPHALGRHRPSRAPILLGGLAVLVAGATAGVYFAAALPGHGAPEPAVFTYRSAGTLTASGYVSSLAYNPNGSQLAGGDGSFISLWDLATLTMSDSFSNPASGDLVIEVTYSSNGMLLASSDGNSVKLWSIATGKVVRTYKPTVVFGNLTIDSVSFSPNGSQLAVGDGNSVKLWSIATGKVVRTYKPTGISGVAGSGDVSSVSFSPDGTILAAAFGNGHTYLWDVATGKPTATFSGDSSVSFSPNGSQLAVGDGNSVKLWNITIQAPAATFSDPTRGDVSSVAFGLGGIAFAITCRNVAAVGNPAERVSPRRSPCLGADHYR
jgi:WD domain, G-beta repeat